VVVCITVWRLTGMAIWAGNGFKIWNCYLFTVFKKANSGQVRVESGAFIRQFYIYDLVMISSVLN